MNSVKCIESYEDRLKEENKVHVGDSYMALGHKDFSNIVAPLGRHGGRRRPLRHLPVTGEARGPEGLPRPCPGDTTRRGHGPKVKGLVRSRKFSTACPMWS